MILSMQIDIISVNVYPPLDIASTLLLPVFWGNQYVTICDYLFNT